MQELVGAGTQRPQNQLRLRSVMESNNHGVHAAGFDPVDHVLHGLAELHNFQNHDLGTKSLDFVQEFRQITQLVLLDQKADG